MAHLESRGDGSARRFDYNALPIRPVPWEMFGFSVVKAGARPAGQAAALLLGGLSI